MKKTVCVLFDRIYDEREEYVGVYENIDAALKAIIDIVNYPCLALEVWQEAPETIRVDTNANANFTIWTNQEVITEGDSDMAKKDWETDGTHNGDPVYCPVNAYGDCPYCDQCNMCHIADTIEDCSDFGMFFESWDEWLAADDVDPDAPADFAEDEIKWAGDVYGYEDTMEDNENYDE